MAYEIENEFIQDPLGFIKENVITPAIGSDKQSGVYGIKLVSADAGIYGVTKRGKHKAKQDTLERYIARIDHNSPLKMYYLYYHNNQAHGMALGTNAATPSFMMTARMNSCTFGYNQLSDQTPAYVSHHNAQNDGNTTAAMESQAINWHNGAGPGGGDYNFSHRTDYMKYIGKEKGQNYGATLLGVRDDSRIWHFYYQISKGHGKKHKDLSLKGVKEIGAN